MLEKLKRLLSVTDTDRDDLLNDLLETAAVRLGLLIGKEEIPSQLEYIVIDVAIVRFNRISSEGVHHHTVEGEHSIYNENDFSPYVGEIESYLSMVDEVRGKTKVKFL